LRLREPKAEPELLDEVGSGGGTRTPDPWIMIPLLYQLSYSAAGRSRM
jgi:hypothetical protein